MGDVEAFGEKNIIGITGAIKRFMASPEDMVYRGLFSDGRPMDINGDTYYFLFEANDYNMSFVCKSIDRSGEEVKVTGFTKEEVAQVISEAGVEYESTKEYFERLNK